MVYVGGRFSTPCGVTWPSLRSKSIGSWGVTQKGAKLRLRSSTLAPKPHFRRVKRTWSTLSSRPRSPHPVTPPPCARCRGIGPAGPLVPFAPIG